MTTAQRQQAYRARQKALGLTEVRGLWAPPVLHRLVKDNAARVVADSLKKRSKA